MAHVSLITLGVDDLERAEAFYQALGWRRSSASVEGEVTFLEGGTVVLGLFGTADLAEDANADVAERGRFENVTLAMNVATDDEVDQILRTAEAAGARIAKSAQKAEWGGYHGYFADPDGHLWEIAHAPGFELDDNGRLLLP